MIEDHVTAAREALRSSAGRLNHWEVDFCSSMLHVRWPSPKQLSVLETLVWKAHAKKPRRARRRKEASR